MDFDSIQKGLLNFAEDQIEMIKYDNQSLKDDPLGNSY